MKIEPAKIESYLRSKCPNLKPVGDQFRLKSCPFCGDQGWHLYVGKETGLWDCKKCGSDGAFYSLKLQFGDLPRIQSASELLGTEIEPARVIDKKIVLKHHQNLFSHPEIISYLRNERGLNLGTIHRFTLGLDVDKSNKLWLTIPHKHNGEYVNIKYRSLPPAKKAFRREEDCATVLFNDEILDKHKTIILTEGEMDAMTLIQNGFPNTVGTTAGAQSFPPEFFDQLITRKKIYICYDPDVPGRKGARKIAQRLGPDMCFDVRLPFKDVDVNTFFLKSEDPVNEFDILLANAKPFGEAHILTVQQAFDTLEERKLDSGGIELPWGNVENLMGNLRPGELTVVSAIPKTGKTSFSLQATHHAICKGHHCLFYCLEMSIPRILERLIAAYRKKSTDQLDDWDITDTKAHLIDKPLYFCGRAAPVEQVFELLDYATRRFDLDLIVFDNLHFLCRSTDNITQEIGYVTKKFKTFATEKDLHVILVVQPKKVAEGRMPGSGDLRDSSLIPADADTSVILFRKRLKDSRSLIIEDDYEDIEGVFESKTLVSVDGTRYHAGGRTVLFFDKDTCTFLTPDETPEI